MSQDSQASCSWAGYNRCVCDALQLCSSIALANAESEILEKRTHSYPDIQDIGNALSGTYVYQLQGMTRYQNSKGHDSTMLDATIEKIVGHTYVLPRNMAEYDRIVKQRQQKEI